MEKIIEKIINNVGKTTKVVVQKSNDVVELTKLKLAINSAENEAHDIMYEIGKLVYRAYKGGEGNPDAIEKKCQKLDEIRAEIDDKKAEYAKLKNMKACIKCDKENDASAVFCSRCGAKLPDVTGYEVDKMPGEDESDSIVIDAEE